MRTRNGATIWRRVVPPRNRDWFGPLAGALTIAVSLSSFFLRPLDPLIEMTWTVYAYHFSTVLLAPLLAGIGVWLGIRHATAKSIIRATHKEGISLGAIWARSATWVLLGYSTGLAVVILAARVSGTPGLPSARALATAVPSVALLGAALAVGIAVGWLTEAWIAVAAVPTAIFALIVFAYSVQLSFVRVGGATASLVGLVPNATVGVLQTVLYVGVAGAALAWATKGATIHRVLGVLALATICVASIGLMQSGETLEARPTPGLRCEDGEVTICLAPEYERYRGPLSEELDSVARAFDEAGAPIPGVFTQDLESPAFGTALIPALRRIKSDPRDVVFGSFSNAYSGSCSFETEPEYDALVRVHQWLDSALENVSDGVAVTLDPQTRLAFTVLESCE